MDRGNSQFKETFIESTIEYIYIYIVGIKFLSLWKSALDSSFNCFAGGPSNINVGIFRRGFCGFTRADSSIMIKVSS